MKRVEDRSMRLALQSFASPVGVLRLVASQVGLCAVLWEKETAGRVCLPEAEPQPGQPILLQAAQELTEYFRRERESFTVPLELRGTPFQQAVWRYLTKIPFGQTRSYIEIAREIGHPGAARAVGAANGRNPISIIVPCHRVIGASGRLTGFAGGLDAKSYLLRLEQPSTMFPIVAVP